MFDLKTYDEEVNRLADIYRETQNDSDLDKLGCYQALHMKVWLSEYREHIDHDDNIRQKIYELVEYAVWESLSGSAIVYVDNEEIANKINEVILEEIGDFILDTPQIYADSHTGEWCIDCMFSGNYVPYWDGWLD